MRLSKIFAQVASLLAHWGTSPELLNEIQKRRECPIPGEEYVHAKTGNRYTVLCIGFYCGKWEQADSYPDDFHVRSASPPATGFPEGTQLVVSVGHYDNKKVGGNGFYIRPLGEWLEEVTLSPPSLLGTTMKTTRFVPAD